MIVMPSNHSSAQLHYWAGKYPGALGHLHSPRGEKRERVYPWLPFALDNGAFGAWKNGTTWEADAFRAHVAHFAPRQPLWILVPDVVADRDATLALWREWADELSALDVPLAFAVQDGMIVADVPSDAAVVFVGGTTAWKRSTLDVWCSAFPRVHVGRINTERWLWRCFQAGAESCDGTGWFHGDKQQLAGLERYLARRADGHTRPAFANHELFEAHA
jgi:hypothetical protein